MLLGFRIINYTIFLDDRAGALLEDYLSGRVNSLKGASAGIEPVIPLSNLNALIGRNQTGKSMFFDALSFVSDSTTVGCTEASVAGGRPGFSRLLSEKGDKMSFELFMLLSDHHNSGKEYYISYTFSLVPDTHGRPSYSSEKVIMCNCRKDSLDQRVLLDLQNGKGKVEFSGNQIDAEVSDTRHSALRSYGSIPQCPGLNVLYNEISHWFFCRFSSNHNGNGRKQQIAPGGHRHLNSDGTNIQNVLDFIRIENPRLYGDLLNRIKKKIPGVGKVSDKLPEDFKKSPDKLFLYLLLLDDPKPRPLICIETPDMGLYHDMVDVLSAEFRDYSIKYPYSQIMFTTHNPYILEAVSPSEVWIFKRDGEESGNIVDIECAGAKPIVAEMYAQGVGMGAIWYGGYFDD